MLLILVVVGVVVVVAVVVVGCCCLFLLVNWLVSLLPCLLKPLCLCPFTHLLTVW